MFIDDLRSGWPLDGAEGAGVAEAWLGCQVSAVSTAAARLAELGTALSRLSWTPDERVSCFQARVPGTVFSNLLRAGRFSELVPAGEDIFVDDNLAKVTDRPWRILRGDGGSSSSQ